MPLPNNAKVSEVINLLNETQGFNQKIELASVIGSPALGTDNVATQISKLQEAKNILANAVNLPNETPIRDLANAANNFVNFASGVTAVSSLNTLTVSGLSFRPYIIIFKLSTQTSNADSYVYVDESVVTEFNRGLFFYYASSSSLSNVKPIINNDGFIFNSLQSRGAAATYSWLAIG